MGHRIDARAQHLGDVGAVGEREGHDAVDRGGLVRDEAKLQRRYTVADQVDDDEQRYATKDVGVDRDERAYRKEHGRVTDAHPRDREPEEEHEDFADEEHPNVGEEASTEGADPLGGVTVPGDAHVVKIEEVVAKDRPAGGDEQYEDDRAYEKDRRNRTRG